MKCILIHYNYSKSVYTFLGHPINISLGRGPLAFNHYIIHIRPQLSYPALPPSASQRISVYFLISTPSPTHKLCSLQLVMLFLWFLCLAYLPFLFTRCSSFLQADAPPPRSRQSLLSSVCSVIAS